VHWTLKMDHIADLEIPKLKKVDKRSIAEFKRQHRNHVRVVASYNKQAAASRKQMPHSMLACVDSDILVAFVSAKKLINVDEDGNQIVDEEGNPVCFKHADEVTDEAVVQWLDSTTVIEPDEIAAIVKDVCGKVQFNADPTDIDGCVMQYGLDIVKELKQRGAEDLLDRPCKAIISKLLHMFPEKHLRQKLKENYSYWGRRRKVPVVILSWSNPSFCHRSTLPVGRAHCGAAAETA
jgi:hypothetical protein